MERLRQLYESWKAALEVWRTLGPWGPFTIATIDAAAFGIPLDIVVGDYALSNRNSIVQLGLGIMLAAIGSAIGSLVPYWIGRKGGEPLLLKKISHRRLEELRDRYEKWEFFFLMVPAMLPPPTPMKLLILAAGTFEMRIPLFMSAIVLGRMVRFVLLTSLLMMFGPQKLRDFGRGFIEHWPLISFAVFALAVLVIVFWRVRSRIASAAK